MSNQVVEIDEQVENAIAEKVSASLEAKLDEKLKAVAVPSAEEIAEKIAEKSEAVAKKDIHESGAKPSIEVIDAFDKLSKEQRFAKGVVAHIKGDNNGLLIYNNYVAQAWKKISKANYQNATTAADGGALVPDPEFLVEVDRLTDDYGVASRLATLRRTDRDSVTIAVGTNEISFVATDEATAQNATKLTYSNATVSLKKYIATLIMTSEIVEDSAIDLFTDATNEIARARAKLFDQLVFTDATHGLLYAPDAGEGWKTHSVGAAITDFDADDAMDATYKVVSSVRRNGRFFMHPTVWNELRQTKSSVSTKDYIFGPVGQMPVPAIDGYAVELVDVLPAVGEITANEPFAVFGDLSRVRLHVKRLLETKVFDSGVVKDAGGSDYNLITQDSWAMRATLRCVPQVALPGAFVILGTGVVS